MIEKTRKTVGLKESKKDYFVLFDNSDVLGVVCSGEQSAQICLGNIAKENGAICLSDSVWKYENSSGEHLLWMKKVKRYNIK